jgi:hypothetical protein
MSLCIIYATPNSPTILDLLDTRRISVYEAEITTFFAINSEQLINLSSSCFWVMDPCRSWPVADVSDEHTASITRPEVRNMKKMIYIAIRSRELINKGQG